MTAYRRLYDTSWLIIRSKGLILEAIIVSRGLLYISQIQKRQFPRPSSGIPRAFDVRLQSWPKFSGHSDHYIKTMHGCQEPNMSRQSCSVYRLQHCLAGVGRGDKFLTFTLRPKTDKNVPKPIGQDYSSVWRGKPSPTCQAFDMCLGYAVYTCSYMHGEIKDNTYDHHNFFILL